MKKILLNLLLVLIPVSFFVFISCEKDDQKTSSKTDKQLSEDIRNIVSDSTLQNIIELGMPVNKGLTPPDIENSYVASPFILKSSNISYDYEGKLFADYYVRFYDQNNDSLTIKLDYSNGGETGTGVGGFLSGSGSRFSVFVEVNSLYLGYPAKMLQIISGTITSEGIKDFYFTNYMLDNYGNEGGYWIENGEGRIIYDSDGISPVTESFKSTQVKEYAGTDGAGLK